MIHDASRGWPWLPGTIHERSRRQSTEHPEAGGVQRRMARAARADYDPSMRPMPLMCLLAASAVAQVAAAADKTLYKCRAADGSLSFQESPCDGEPLEVIPIAPEAKPSGASATVSLDTAGCRDLAKVIWRLDGSTTTFDVSADARRELTERRATLRDRCGLTLDPSPLAVDCALLAEAMRLRRGDATAIDEAAHARIATQHAERCSDAAINADLDRALRRLEDGR